jgi:hypothetical protein
MSDLLQYTISKYEQEHERHAPRRVRTLSAS